MIGEAAEYGSSWSKLVVKSANATTAVS